jgi:hypothetical protein
MTREDQQERRKHHDAQHLGDDGRRRRLVTDRPGGHHDLRHLVNRGSGVEPERVLRQVQVGIRERVDEHSKSPEDDDRCHGNGDLVCLAADDGLCGNHGGRTADRTAGADQHRRFAVEAQNASVTNYVKPALAALGAVMQQCVACHAAYRLH